MSSRVKPTIITYLLGRDMSGTRGQFGRLNPEEQCRQESLSRQETQVKSVAGTQEHFIAGVFEEYELEVGRDVVEELWLMEKRAMSTRIWTHETDQGIS